MENQEFAAVSKFISKYEKHPDYTELLAECLLVMRRVMVCYSSDKGDLKAYVSKALRNRIRRWHLERKSKKSELLVLSELPKKTLANLACEFVENRSWIKEELTKLLDALPDRQRDMIAMYHGIGYDDDYTLLQIAQKYKVTKERVRQIVNRGLVKMADHDNPKGGKSAKLPPNKLKAYLVRAEKIANTMTIRQRFDRMKRIRKKPAKIFGDTNEILPNRLPSCEVHQQGILSFPQGNCGRSDRSCEENHQPPDSP